MCHPVYFVELNLDDPPSSPYAILADFCPAQVESGTWDNQIKVRKTEYQQLESPCR